MDHETFLTITKVFGAIAIFAALVACAACNPYGD